MESSGRSSEKEGLQITESLDEPSGRLVRVQRAGNLL